MAAARPATGRPLCCLILPVIVLVAVICATTTAEQPAANSVARGAGPLRALRSEEGNIDDIIFRIERLRQLRQKQKHQQQLKQAASTSPPVAKSSGSHPEREFAYYPSDPEYRAKARPGPVNPESTASDGNLERHGTDQAEVAGPTALDGNLERHGTEQAEVAGPTGSPPDDSVPVKMPPPATTSGPVPAPEVAALIDTSPSEGQHPLPQALQQTRPERRKKASSDTQVLRVEPNSLLAPAPSRDNTSDIYFIVTVAGICAMAVGVAVGGGFCYHRLQKRAKSAGDAEYPAYGVTGPSRDLSPSGDRKLAQSAQMYHYQHQKQQMMAMEKTHNGRHGSASDVDSEEENEEGEYTVYECPGLAPTGEMEVKNPLFHDDHTPAPASSNGENNTK